MTAFDVNLLLQGQYHDMLVAGLRISLLLAGTTWLLSLPLALLVAVARLSPLRWLNAVGAGYVNVVRNIPLLAHLLFWYFGVPELLPESWRQWLYDHDYELVAAVAALTIYTVSYMSEDIRSGIRTVPVGQQEAARALGLGFGQTLVWVVLPQALRVTIAPLLSQTLNLWKNTSIATVIGTAELMYQASKMEAEIFRSVEAFTFATVSYLSVSLLITALAAYAEHRYRSSAR